MTAVIAGDADLRIGAKAFARLARVAVFLPQMHAIGIQTLGQADRIIDDEGHLIGSADLLKRHGQRRRGMFVHALHAELESGHAMLVLDPGGQNTLQPFGKIPGHVQRRDQIDLGARAQLSGTSSPKEVSSGRISVSKNSSDMGGALNRGAFRRKQSPATQAPLSKRVRRRSLSHPLPRTQGTGWENEPTPLLAEMSAAGPIGEAHRRLRRFIPIYSLPL
jgi:hypothetical protein